MFAKTLHYTYQTLNPQIKNESSVLIAGSAVRDITPPAGMPKAGYSSNAHSGKGFRTRLKVRVFYLRSNNQPLAFVQLDALGGSLIVRLEVLKRIAEYTDIAPQNLVLGATHTHAGAGQYCASNFYNRFASNKSGFDATYFDFLCGQISEAMIEAYQQAKPAKIAYGQAEIWGLTRNRSLIPHHQNQQRLVTNTLNHAKFYAINPTLTLLRIDAQHTDGQYYPLGAISTFSIHGTGVSQHEDEYNGDVWAYIERELEQGVQQHYHCPHAVLHAAVEGTHGDIAPNIRYGAAGYLEARRVGEAIGQQALSLFKKLDNQLQADALISSALRVLDMRQPEFALPKPAVGAALLAGAQENLTPIIHHLPPFKAGLGIDKHKQGEHGAKHKLLPSILRDLVLPQAEFPHLLPLQLFTIAGFAFVGFPMEITVQAGRYIYQHVKQQLTDIECLTISSVCNDYFGYCTTQEEYGCQYYEGGHTLYGAKTNEFLAHQAAQLASQLVAQGSFNEQPDAWHFALKQGRYMPLKQTATGQRSIVVEPHYIDAQGLHEGYWQFEWCDVNVSLINWHEPLVSIEYSDGGNDWYLLTNDEACDVSVRYVKSLDKGMAHYQSRWFNPEFYGKRVYRFSITSRPHYQLLNSAQFGGNVLV
ncbi:MAG: neutral/alkaline non-lysosomal ceramidase N-terminal domain-containing protein [Moraxellaceae bacterium]|nr:neutral/alkaline non-lysosomal ceramidase N-terminal domain-containing protein [Moraxellaceae bacterium]